MILHNVKGIKRDTTITNFTSNCAIIKHLRARGDPPPAKGREALQVRGAAQGRPELHRTNSTQTTSIAQGKTCYKIHK